MENLDLFEAVPNYATFSPNIDDYDLFGDYAFNLDVVDFQLPDDNSKIDAFNFLFEDPGATPRDVSSPMCNSNELPNIPPVDSVPPCLMTGAANEYLQTKHSSTATQIPPKLHKSLQIPLSDSIHRPTSHSKHKWQDNVTVFSARGKRIATQRRRRPYSPSRKEIVALNRLIGACVQCKLRKGPVSKTSCFSFN